MLGAQRTIAVARGLLWSEVLVCSRVHAAGYFVASAAAASAAAAAVTATAAAAMPRRRTRARAGRHAAILGGGARAPCTFAAHVRACCTNTRGEREVRDHDWQPPTRR